MGVSKIRLYIRLLEILILLYYDGWVDGWVGGDFLPPSIFLIFKYDNKLLTVIPKMCLKVASAYYMRSYEQFKFQILEI